MNIDNEYGPYQNYIYGITFPEYPFNARVFRRDGTTETLNIAGSEDIALFKDVVAVSFQKIDPIKVEAARLLKMASCMSSPGWTTEWLVEMILRIQQEEGTTKKVDVNPQGRPLWFENLMERKRINGESERKTIYAWYTDTQNPCADKWSIPTALARKLENELLSTRPWTGGGRMVITPYGHALAITNAKKLYWKWKAGERGGAYGMGSHENTGARKPHYSKRTIHINGAFIEIGCQRIPSEAFTKLAETLKWPDRDPYEYIR